MPTPKRLLSTLAAVTLTFAAPSAPAAEVTYTAQLTGAANVPTPHETRASGELKLVVAPDGRSVRYVLTVKEIENVAAGDIHLGPPAANGPLVVKLFPKGGAGPRKGMFSGVLAEGKFDASDLTGPMTGASLEELLEQIRDGNAYCNVHTNDGKEPSQPGPGNYRVGEIRGQIQ